MHLRDYDYTRPGAYFVTICSHGRQSLFGEITGDHMNLNANGRVVEAEWIASARIRPSVALDAFVVMPNHIHGIIVLHDVGATRCVAHAGEKDGDGEGTGVGGYRAVRAIRSVARPGDNAGEGRATRRVAPTGPASGSVGAIIGQVKSKITRRINTLRNTPGAPVWQRGYYEHVIRNEDQLRRARAYIVGNPARWVLDRENPERIQRP